VAQAAAFAVVPDNGEREPLVIVDEACFQNLSPEQAFDADDEGWQCLAGFAGARELATCWRSAGQNSQSRSTLPASPLPHHHRDR
jgi:hypothetical protein